jgi:hypothetical protein
MLDYTTISVGKLQKAYELTPEDAKSLLEKFDGTYNCKSFCHAELKGKRYKEINLLNLIDNFIQELRTNGEFDSDGSIKDNFNLANFTIFCRSIIEEAIQESGIDFYYRENSHCDWVKRSHIVHLFPSNPRNDLLDCIVTTFLIDKRQAVIFIEKEMGYKLQCEIQGITKEVVTEFLKDHEEGVLEKQNRVPQKLIDEYRKAPSRYNLSKANERSLESVVLYATGHSLEDVWKKIYKLTAKADTVFDESNMRANVKKGVTLAAELNLQGMTQYFPPKKRNGRKAKQAKA